MVQKSKENSGRTFYRMIDGLKNTHGEIGDNGEK